MASQKFIFFSDQVVTLCANFSDMPIEDHSFSGLQVELDDLERRWRQLVQIYETEMTSEDPGCTQAVRSSIHAKFSESCKSYKNCKASILDLMHIERQKLEKTTSKDEPSMKVTEEGGYALKVPPCDTEFFSGGYDKWPSFRDMFTAIYTKHPKLSPAQRLFHLRAKTRGEANQIVKQFALTDDNFNLAWEALRQRYENRRILINHQLRKIFEIDPVTSEKGKGLRNLLYIVNNCLAVLRTYNISIITWDPFLVYWVSSKLPEETLTAWENSIHDHRQMPSWSQLDDFISKRLSMLESISDMRRPSRDSSSSNKAQNFHTKSDSYFRPCKVCRLNHTLRQCTKFKSWPLKEKLKFVTDNKICRNCLSYGHFDQKCQSEHVCQKCQQKHHTMLHPESCNSGNHDDNLRPSKPGTVNNQRESHYQTETYHLEADYEEEPSTSAAANSTTCPTSNVQLYFSDSGESTVLPTALVDIEHLGILFTIRVFIDQGSQESFISNRIINRLSIPTKKSFTRISGLGGAVLENSSKVCVITLKSRRSDYRLQASAIVVSSLNQLMPGIPTQISDWSSLNCLELADPNFSKPGQIDMLLGSDVLPSIIRSGIRKNVSGGLLAQETEFGWLISGPPTTRTVTTLASWVTSNDSLNEDIRKFWELEEVPVARSVSEDDAWCEEYYKKTTSRLADGKYVVRLPFRQNLDAEMFLGSSRRAAMGQYLRMEKTLKSSPELASEYTRVLEEYLKLGHMDPAPSTEIYKNNQYCSFYLPHHAVVRPESASTKVRVVFNASKKTSTGVSLNDILHTGPTLQNDLMNVILRWRFFKYVFNGDIEKMYRQIHVHMEDRPFQKILFRNSQTEGVQDFCLNTVTFGVNCAPYLAIRTLLQLSDDGKSTHPTAASILQSQIYVDDILSGGHTLIEARSYILELIDLLQSAGFPLKKLTANHSTILRDLPPEDLLTEDFLKFEETSDTKMLGIRWNAMTDQFFYKVTTISVPSTPITKRKILSIVAKLFDPAGWLAPIIVMAKMLMQQLWIDGTDWDEEVKPHSLEKWETFISNFSLIENIKVPRWINFSPECVLRMYLRIVKISKQSCFVLSASVKKQGSSFENYKLTQVGVMWSYITI
ncbi:uncharacterized protein LOC131997951 [Stomoxys calcitrans]|uniref:uncharacterized protein LOC131994831 n=1 Tax=Stomoxys calcitrans TaxID=35570 RepID=UPI0027E27F89|nr:uncharacterized protein LOC131994831 [Stomoxys calcitrans]XP_059225829.1 uncharacterized protein LOC131997951 [Stomoxys calcitrans]